MPVSNPKKTVSSGALDCTGSTTVTLSFDAQPSLSADPADIVLIMDRSGSTNGAPMAAAKAAAKQLVKTVALASGSADGTTIENGSRLGLVSFADTATRDVELTGDVAAMNAGLSALASNGFTNHVAAFQAAEEMMQTATAARKVMILFTDGNTTVGGSADATAEAIRQTGVEIYCIGLATDPTPLEVWASGPTATHVASTDQISQLALAFAEIAAEVVEAGALDMVLRETLNPDFKITAVGQPSRGTADVQTPQTLEWKANAVGTTGNETASLTFTATHIGTRGGVKDINQSVLYDDRAGETLDFVSPKVDVNCDQVPVVPEPCPLPTTFAAESCQDTVVVDANATKLTGLGRIVQVDAVIQNVCPGKRVAAALILTELDANGVERARGTKTVLIPAQTGTTCQSVELKCISFVVPEELSLSGETASICGPRGFRVRVLANYVDSDFVCCDPQTVII